jgi:hypothetical protein
LKVAPNAGLSGVSAADNLSFGTGAKLDLTNNRLITADPVGAAQGASGLRTYNGITGLVQAARNGGLWYGPGITTSEAAALADNGEQTTLATVNVAEAFAVEPTDTFVWAGQTVSGADTLVMYTWAGDTDLDGAVTVSDYAGIDFYVGSTESGYYKGNFNYDGIIEVGDYAYIDFNIGVSTPPPSPPAGPAASRAYRDLIEGGAWAG